MNNKNTLKNTNPQGFDNSLIKEKLISLKFKKIVILEIVSIILTLLSFIAIVLSAIYLQSYLQAKIKYKDNQSNISDYTYMVNVLIPVLIAFLVIGCLLLVGNYVIVPLVETKIAWSEYNNYNFILKTCNSKNLKANVNIFLGSKKKSSIYWYLFFFSFIGIPWNIYIGLQTTYNSTRKKMIDSKNNL